MEKRDPSHDPEYAVNGFYGKNRMFPSVKSTSLFMLAVFGSYFFVQIIMVLLLQKLGLTDKYNESASFYYAFNALYELIYLGVPLLFMILYYNGDRAYFLRINSMSGAELIITVILGLFVFAANIFVTEVNVILASFISEISIPQAPDVVSVTDKLIFMLMLAVVAPIIEELLMRGVIMRGLEGRSKWFAIIVTGMFFGMIHLSYYTVAAKISVGILLCYIAYVTGSVYSGIIVHMINNGISGLITIMSSASVAQEETAVEMSLPQMLLSLMVYMFLAMVSIVIVVALAKALEAVSKKAEGNGRYRRSIREKLPSEQSIRPYAYIPMAIAFILMTAIMVADCIAA